MRGRLLAIAATALLLTACGGDPGGLQVVNPRIGKPLVNTAALYMTIENNTDRADRLVAVRTPAARLTELHVSVTSDDGIVRMERQGVFEVGPGETLALEPGDKHVMLLGVDPLEVDDTVTIVLEWEIAGSVEIEAVVVPAGLAGSG